jgi:hypothetical protein
MSIFPPTVDIPLLPIAENRLFIWNKGITKLTLRFFRTELPQLGSNGLELRGADRRRGVILMVTHKSLKTNLTTLLKARRR